MLRSVKVGVLLSSKQFYKIKKITIAIITLVLFLNTTNMYAFDKSKDLLVANFDLCPDNDDIHSITALGCQFLHPDFKGVNFVAVSGAYGFQYPNMEFIPIASPLFEMAFGAKNSNWVDAHNDRSNALSIVKKKIKATLRKGGKVFVQEAGQSDFTCDVLKGLIADGFSDSIIKKNVFVIQHSFWNEEHSNQSKLEWVKANTQYFKIDDGNVEGNSTPGYNGKDTTWLTAAKESKNLNTKARDLWIIADEICRKCPHHQNKITTNGGVDFSDNVEIWWIFKLGDKASNVSKFWSRYVTNTPSTK
jgi:hypothetical protein